MKVIALLAALMLTMGAMPAQDRVPPAPAITVAVSDFQDRHPFLEQDWIAAAVPDLIVAALMRATQGGGAGVLVLDRSSIGALESEARLAGGAGPAHGAGATHVIGGSFIISDGIVQLDAALAAIGQPPSWSQHYSVPVAALSALAQRIARGALAALNAPVGDVHAASLGARDLPVAAMVTFHRGREAMRRGDHAWALADLLRTCKLAPDFGEAWLLLGTTLEALGRPAAALAAWEQASMADPDDPAMPASLYRLARALENPADQGPARRLYQRLVDDYPFAIAPADIASRSAERNPTYALLAAGRLAALSETPPASGAAAANRSAAAPTAVPAGGQDAGGGAIVAAARLRQYRLRLDAHARDQYLDAADDWTLRHVLFEACGGWPADLPAVRLRADEAVALPRIIGNERMLPVMPPDGQLIESLSLAVAPLQGFDPTGFQFAVVAECRDTAASSMATTLVVASSGGGPASAAIAPQYAGGFFASIQLSRLAGHQQPVPESGKMPGILLTAKLRPIRPGRVWVVTQPPGMFIRMEGAFRGVSPCLIRDCAPGPAEIEAESRDRFQASDPRPQSPYLHFHGKATIAIASAGETRVEWSVPHAPDSPAVAWSRLQLAVPAPLVAEISRSAAQARTKAKPAITAHPRLGWIAAWTFDHEILITASADARSWRPPLPLHANPIADESLLGLSVAPSGQILALYLRDHSVFACTSDNLTSWSAPAAILQGKPDNTPHVLGTQADGQGRWTLVVERYQFADQVYTSADGGSWKVEQSSLEHPQGMYSSSFATLDSFADGRPALVVMGTLGKTACLLRFGLGDDRHWTLRDHSPPIASDQISGLEVAGDHLYEIFDQSGRGSRWRAGGAVTPAGGLVLPGEACAIGHGPQGALLLASAAGSWWVAHEAASEAQAQAQEVAPLVSYERPDLAPLPAATAPAPPSASARAAPAPAAPPAREAVPASAALEHPPATASPAPGSAPAAPPARRSLLHLAAGLMAALIGLAGGVLAVRRWWRRRQGAAP